MIDQVNFVEGVIGRELPPVTVFRNSAPAGEIGQEGKGHDCRYAWRTLCSSADGAGLRRSGSLNKAQWMAAAWRSKPSYVEGSSWWIAGKPVSLAPTQ